MVRCRRKGCTEYPDCKLIYDCPFSLPEVLKDVEVKANKYNAEKTVYNGIEFDSKREANRYAELLILERSGQITGLNRQIRYELIPLQKDESGKCLERAVSYIADFVYKDIDGQTVVEDTKGMRTKEYVIKRKLMLYIHGIRIKEI